MPLLCSRYYMNKKTPSPIIISNGFAPIEPIIYSVLHICDDAFHPPIFMQLFMFSPSSLASVGITFV